MKQEEVCERNKKDEILSAYRKLLKKVEEQKRQQVSPKEEKQRQEIKKIVEEAQKFTVGGIVKGLTDIKLKIGESLKEIEETFATECGKFTDLRKAIESSRTELEEVYEININCNTLAALIEAQQEMKEEFDHTMQEKKDSLRREIIEQRDLWEKEGSELERERNREKEEYGYTLTLTRKREKDAYEAGKAELERELKEYKEREEKELSERERDISEREEEQIHLKMQVESFPQKLEGAIEQAEERTAERVQAQYQFEIELAAKENEGNRKLLEQRIDSLQKKVKEQEQQIAQLTAKVNDSGLQVRDIAVKAIEGASHRIREPGREFKSNLPDSD